MQTLQKRNLFDFKVNRLRSRAKLFCQAVCHQNLQHVVSRLQRSAETHVPHGRHPARFFFLGPVQRARSVRIDLPVLVPESCLPRHIRLLAVPGASVEYLISPSHRLSGAKDALRFVAIRVEHWRLSLVIFCAWSAGNILVEHDARESEVTTL